ncbi:hypothetical protein [Flavobacterium marginilacus]|nr:hypothetical protein [Flavobacterium marginilacus]
MKSKFYTSWIVIFGTLRGVMWTFEWVSQAEYWMASVGKERIDYLI